MRTLATLITLLPGAAFAHGAHAPVSVQAHSMAHATPLLALAVAAALGLGLYLRWRQ